MLRSGLIVNLPRSNPMVDEDNDDTDTLIKTFLETGANFSDRYFLLYKDGFSKAYILHE